MIISITVSHLFEDYFYEKELNKSREKSKLRIDLLLFINFLN